MFFELLATRRVEEFAARGTRGPRLGVLGSNPSSEFPPSSDGTLSCQGSQEGAVMRVALDRVLTGVVRQ